MDTIQLKGKYLRQALELSVTSYDTEDPDGAFLQVSGKINLNFSELSCWTWNYALRFSERSEKLLFNLLLKRKKKKILNDCINLENSTDEDG